MINKTAIIDSKAKIGSNVKIGPYSIIGPNVEIGDHSTVQPNCGEKICLKRNAGGPNGWNSLRPKVKRKPKPKKPKPKAQKRKVPPGGSPSGKRRKQGDRSKQL